MRKHGLVARTIVQVEKNVYRALGYPAKDDDVVVLPEGKKVTETTPVLPEELKIAMRYLSEASGYRFRILFSHGPSVPPFVREKGIVNIVIGASPPGAVAHDPQSKLLGLDLERPGYNAMRYGGVLGYGELLKDAEGVEFAQIVDTTIYLLVPVGSRPQLMLLSAAAGPGLFHRAFSRAWNAFFKKREGPKSEPIASFAQFSAHMQARVEYALGSAEEVLAEHEVRIDIARERLYSRIEERRVVIATKNAIERYLTDVQANAEADWNALSAHPLIARMHQVNGALQIQTKTIIADHNGRRYRLGRYCIRYSLGQRISVWPLETFHPERVAHPHISKSGIICFGNIEQALAEAAAELRSSEVITMVLRWLVEGYDPRLADTPIEQWPLEKERVQLLASEKTL